MKRITRLGPVATSSGPISSPAPRAGAHPASYEGPACDGDASMLAGGMAAGDTPPQLASGGGSSPPVDASNVPLEYPHRINTYARPPTYDISIEHFEEYALARLQRKCRPTLSPFSWVVP